MLKMYKNDKIWRIMKRRMCEWYLMPIAFLIGMFIALFGILLWVMR
jgi:hypothetical protein